MGDSRRLSNYKKDMESLFNEVDNRERINLFQNQSAFSYNTSKSNLPTSRGVNSLNMSQTHKHGKKSLQIGVSEKDLLSYYNTSKHVFEGNSPFIEMNFSTNQQQQTRRRRVISSNENKNSLHKKLSKRLQIKQKI